MWLGHVVVMWSRHVVTKWLTKGLQQTLIKNVLTRHGKQKVANLVTSPPTVEAAIFLARDEKRNLETSLLPHVVTFLRTQATLTVDIVKKRNRKSISTSRSLSVCSSGMSSSRSSECHHKPSRTLPTMSNRWSSLGCVPQHEHVHIVIVSGIPARRPSWRVCAHLHHLP